MKTIDLLTPLLDNGIRNINFFNGRLLSAEDLSADQAATRQRLELLGNAVGEGIAYGLEVSLASQPSPPKKTPLLKVNAGLAVNRKGRTIHLPEDTTVALLAEEEEYVAATEGTFAACVPPTTAVYQTGTGVFILAITHAEGFDGTAPMSGLGNTAGGGRACGRRYAIEGVQFRLIEMNMKTLEGIDPATRTEVLALMDKTDGTSISKLRNMLAHLCFGTEQLMDFARDPFRETTKGTSPFLAYGAIDAMRQKNKITDCDVPLAMIYWNSDGVQFVDLWSVRRRLVDRNTSVKWPLTADERKQAEGEAMFLQFQEQLAAVADLRSQQALLGSLIATDYFRYLPAAGILPITATYIQAYQKESGAVPITIAKQSRGLNPPKFFEGLTTRKPVFIEGARIEPLLSSGRHYPPIDLTSKELIWVYLIRENAQTIAKQPLTAPQAYLVFASGHMPYLGNARYNVAKWDYSDYAFV